MRVCTYRFSLGLFIISATIILNIIYIYDLHYIPTLSFSTLTNWEGDVLSTKSPELHRTTAPCGTYPSHFQKTHLNPSIILAMVKPGSPLPTSIAWFISRLILCKGAEPQNHCRGLHPLLASVKTGQQWRCWMAWPRIKRSTWINFYEAYMKYTLNSGSYDLSQNSTNQLLWSIHEVHLKQRLIWISNSTLSLLTEFKGNSNFLGLLPWSSTKWRAQKLPKASEHLVRKQWNVDGVSVPSHKMCLSNKAAPL